ncbi:TetR/AcrR family transcriptional regulator [Streptomyces varsoviensis]|uniref:TetR/AcrR family transcriptional regulator n=1 Tax=Streptomyces varsoviensis TaxID=67373 RepID=UPI0033D2054C
MTEHTPTADPDPDPDAKSGAGTGTGIRPRKRERTRGAIYDAAFRLFAEQGFDSVTLTRIAAEADVAPATVFTHFASKEDIFFSRRQEFIAKLPGAVADAPTEAELLAQLRDYYIESFELVLSDDWIDRGRVFARILLGSPALRRSFLPLLEQRRLLLTEHLIERAGAAGADPVHRQELTIFAAFVISVGTTAFGVLHSELTAGEPADRVREEVHDVLDRGFDRLTRAYAGTGLLDLCTSAAREGASS